MQPSLPSAGLLAGGNWQCCRPITEHERISADCAHHAKRIDSYPPQGLPTRTFKTNLAIEQGLEQLDLVNYGSAHTDGDTVIYVAPANIAVVGDIFSNPYYPVIDLSSGGSIDGLIYTVDQVLAHIDTETKIIPGHGLPATRADLEAHCSRKVNKTSSCGRPSERVRCKVGRRLCPIRHVCGNGLR